ncbi:hypothetical protein BVRB_5g117390 [Beta vulgaris subsp. vulgaris]|nr:hypothetical protein BVRB_5g117390 [Beta vulgaris subsp. vulgaris]
MYKYNSVSICSLILVFITQCMMFIVRIFLTIWTCTPTSLHNLCFI